MLSILRRLKPSNVLREYHPEQDPVVSEARKQIRELQVQRSLLQGTLDRQGPTGFLLGDAVLGRQEEDRKTNGTDS